MIIVPANANLSSKMLGLIKFFNQLENDLQYPNCEGRAEEIMRLKRAEIDLIMLGKI